MEHQVVESRLDVSAPYSPRPAHRGQPMRTGAAGAAGLEPVLQELADALPALSAATCSRIHAQLDAYSEVDAAALASAVERNMRTSLTALRSGRVPEPASLAGAAQTARERHRSGLRVEEIVQGFRISIALIHERFVDLAVSSKLPVALVVEGTRILWGVADAFTSRIITEYHELEVSAALHDAQRRTALVHALLSAEPRTVADLDPQGAYAALWCLVPDGQNPETVRRRLEAGGSSGHHRAIVAVEGDRCLGVVARRPPEDAIPVGLGPFVSPTDLHRSDRVARQALALALHLRRTGIQSIDTLGWRLAAADRTDVWRAYHTRFVAPLDEQGPFGGEVLGAVRQWLDAGHNVAAVAGALKVHVNTVRYRLQRFEQLTGADLSSPDDLLGILWALEMGDPDSFSL